MRSYTINLPRGLEVDIFNLPENFVEEINRVNFIHAVVFFTGASSLRKEKDTPKIAAKLLKNQHTTK